MAPISLHPFQQLSVRTLAQLNMRERHLLLNQICDDVPGVDVDGDKGSDDVSVQNGQLPSHQGRQSVEPLHEAQGQTELWTDSDRIKVGGRTADLHRSW